MNASFKLQFSESEDHWDLGKVISSVVLLVGVNKEWLQSLGLIWESGDSWPPTEVLCKALMDLNGCCMSEMERNKQEMSKSGLQIGML